ncbi:hypothetical protein [Rhizobium sp. Rhizsp82]|uniref:hypothetical protein n=1 Tax=Rhizobium sp. Rhizsp82 TaxID=3243057 RepID=UPI0039B4857A
MMAGRRLTYAGLALVQFCLAAPCLADDATLPDDVRAFISRRDDCDHFRGEASPDEERQAEIDQQLRTLCSGSDAELARLKHRYARNKTVRKALGDYDPNIEGGSPD